MEILGVRFSMLSDHFKEYLRNQTEIMTNKEKQKQKYDFVGTKGKVS